MGSKSEAGPSIEGLDDVGILSLPVEISLKIFGLLDLESALSFSDANTKFKGIFHIHGETLILSILERDLSPFDDLLQHIVSGPDDLDVPWGPCLRRRIYHNGRLVSEGEVPRPDHQGEAHALDLLPPAMLDQSHFQALIRAHRTVKEWEAWFPQYRFRDCPSDCRALRPREAERLRGALYHWMSYARYFHGDGLPRPGWGIGEGSPDLRCRKLRLLSNAELCQLNDLWQTAVSMVQMHICPSTEQVMMENVSGLLWIAIGPKKLTMPQDGNITLHEAENLSFGSASPNPLRSSSSSSSSYHYDHGGGALRHAGGHDGAAADPVNAAIVDTFLKLPPADILQLAASRFARSRDRLAREVALAHPCILWDRQSLGHALAAVLAERQPARFLTEHYGRNYGALFASQGGILDYDAADEWLRGAMDHADPREAARDWALERWSRPSIRGPSFGGRGRLVP